MGYFKSRTPELNSCTVRTLDVKAPRVHQYSACNCEIDIPKIKLKKYSATPRCECLAQPRICNTKFRPKCVEMCKRQIEVIRVDPPSRRIEQLAIPTVRKIIPTKAAYKHVIAESRYRRLDNVMKKSMFTLYSRLANIQMPPQKPKTKKWTQQDWDRHKQWLMKRALPKKEIVPDRPERESVPLEELQERINLMATPRHPREKYEGEEPEYAVKRSALTYQHTERILVLAKPKHERVKGKAPDDSPVVAPNALTYRITPRMKALSEPKPAPPSDGRFKSNAFLVSPNAIKAKARPRILELAVPKAVNKR